MTRAFGAGREADPPLPHPTDEDLSVGAPIAKDDRKKGKSKDGGG
jgi:hypothetical protein